MDQVRYLREPGKISNLPDALILLSEATVDPLILSANQINSVRLQPVSGEGTRLPVLRTNPACSMNKLGVFREQA